MSLHPLELHVRSKRKALEARSSRREVRNPVLALPTAKRIDDMPLSARKALSDLLLELSRDAGERAQECWRKAKGPMAVYWKAVSVYAKHISRAVRP